SPSTAPGARLTSARARCPVITATRLPTSGSRVHPSRPKTRLTMASTLVCRPTAGAAGGGGGNGGGVGSLIARFSLQVELDALGQRQFVGVVDGVGLAAHVRTPCIRARLAAAAGFLLAADRAADLWAGGADVDVGDAAVRTAHRQELLGRLQVLGEDRRRQALRHVVLHVDGFVQVA